MINKIFLCLDNVKSEKEINRKTYLFIIYSSLILTLILYYLFRNTEFIQKYDFIPAIYLLLIGIVTYYFTSRKVTLKIITFYFKSINELRTKSLSMSLLNLSFIFILGIILFKDNGNNSWAIEHFLFLIISITLFYFITFNYFKNNSNLKT